MCGRFINISKIDKIKKNFNINKNLNKNSDIISYNIAPSQKVNLDVFLNETEEMSPEVCNLLVDIYLGETAFPPHILREYLLFQQKHYNWVQPDPAIQKTNLNIFQCRTIEDWFGPRFLELCALLQQQNHRGPI